jgi:hypothetical protein
MAKYEGRRRRPLTRRQAIGLAGGAVLTAAGTIAAPDLYTRLVDKLQESNEPEILRPKEPLTGPSDTAPNGLFADRPGSTAYLIPRRPQEIETPPFTRQQLYGSWPSAADWCRTQGAIPAYSNRTILEVAAQTDRMVIAGVSIKVLTRLEPLEGCILQMGGGGDLWRRSLLVDLDYDPPPLVHSGPYSERDWDFPISAGRSDTLLLNLQCTTSNYAEYEIAISYTHDGAPGTSIVRDDDDRPFRVTNTASAYWQWDGSDAGGWSQRDRPRPSKT